VIMCEQRSTSRSLLEVKGITKSFGPMRVLHNVDLHVDYGEIVALLGLNGAGKSTLIKIISGEYNKDSGTIRFDGIERTFQSPRAARQLGIRVLPQEIHVVPDLTVGENILLSDFPIRRVLLLSWADRTAVEERARAILCQLGVSIDPKRPVRTLPVAQQRIVEIASALAGEARLLILDEPTATLTAQETAALFNVLRRLRTNGAGVIFITHRLDEAFEIADRIVVLRDGTVVGEFIPHRSSPSDVVRAMVGRTTEGESQLTDHKVVETDSILLQVRELRVEPELRGITFDVRRGEILGIFGLLGSGVEVVGRAIFGGLPRSIVAGTIELRGNAFASGSPLRSVRSGIGFVPADRRRDGLVLDLDVAANMTLPIVDRFVSHFGMVDRRREDSATRRWLSRLQIRCQGPRQRVRWLSGGNQQKVLLARWFEAQAELLILEEPTRGVDVRAREEIHRIITDMAQSGTTFIIISTDVEEVTALCDRVLVLARGRHVATFARGVSSRELMHAAAYTAEASAGS
jgi:ribose transport system ATP-binding protein